MPEFMVQEQPNEGWSRRTMTTVLALFLVAALIRFYQLGTWSFWADEVATLRDAKNLANVKFYPIGYALIGWWTSMFSESEFAARFVPALAGALTVPLLYIVGYRMFSERVGMFAALFLMLSTYHLFFSQFARYYTLLMLFSLLAMWLLWEGFSRNNTNGVLVGLFCLSISFLTHWSAALLIPAVAVWLLLEWKAGALSRGRNRRNILILLIPALVLGVLLIPAVLMFLKGWGVHDGFSLKRAALAAAKLAYRYEITVGFCAIVGAWMMWAIRDRRLRWILCYGILPPLLLIIFIGFSQGGSRFGIVALPAILLLAAYAIDLMLQSLRGKRRIMVGAVLALCLFSMAAKDVAYFTREMGQRPRWREAVAYTLERAGEHEGMSFLGKPSAALLAHYGSHSPAYEKIYGAGSDRKPCYVGSASAYPKYRYLLIEHTPNVAPSPKALQWITANMKLEKEWPLRIGPFGMLDYSISLYSRPVSLLSMPTDDESD
jgi:4-amino-4-deoxy-L-arabinose transferase-like glycosyltransferase